jgi:hypothetical protein
MQVLLTDVKVEHDSMSFGTLGGGSAHVAGRRRIKIQCEATSPTPEQIAELMQGHNEVFNLSSAHAVSTSIGAGVSSSSTVSGGVSGLTATDVLSLQRAIDNAMARITTLTVELDIAKGDVSRLNSKILKMEGDFGLHDGRLNRLEYPIPGLETPRDVEVRKKLAELEERIELLAAPPQPLGGGIPGAEPAMEPGAWS